MSRPFEYVIPLAVPGQPGAEFDYPATVTLHEGGGYDVVLVGPDGDRQTFTGTYPSHDRDHRASLLALLDVANRFGHMLPGLAAWLARASEPTETAPSLRANGHIMISPLRNGRPVDSQAWCATTCGACYEGYDRPDW